MPGNDSPSQQESENQILREELDHFIRLSQVQAEQLERYQILQQRSHRMIQKLHDQLIQLRELGSTSFRKKSRMSSSRPRA